jgi:hypothetical protein
MNIKTIRKHAIARLGAMELRRFDYARKVTFLLRPIFFALIILQLSQAVCDYVSVSERALTVNKALVQAQNNLNQKSVASFDASESSDRLNVARYSGVASARALEIINRLAVAAGVKIDEVRAVKGCDTEAPLTRQRIQITFRSSFRNAAEFNRKLNAETEIFVTESLLIERYSKIGESETTNSKICVAIVPSSS